MANNANTQELMQRALTELRPLTDDERLDAMDNARAVVVKAAGEKPRRDQFNDVMISKYPTWFTKLIAVFMVIVFAAAAMPSLFRLYTAGYDYFLKGIDSPFLASIVGVSTFLLAEFLIILSTISARIYFEGRTRLIFIIPIGLGLAMALVGNWVIAQPTDLFGWLETLSPPLAVLFLALIGEKLVLDSIQSMHANEKAYKTALLEWQESTREPEQSPRWKGAYANALKQMIRDVNAKKTGANNRKELMMQLKSSQWRTLVMRELRADSWFDNPMDELEPTITVESNGNGHHKEDFFNSPVVAIGHDS